MAFPDHSLPTTKATFEEWGVLRGNDIVAGKVTTPELNAFLTDVPRWTAEPKVLLPLAELRAWSQGRLTAETLAWGVRQLLDPLAEAVAAGKEIKGVLLALHGAMVAVGDDDPEGTVLAAARAIVGLGVPIVATVDLHVHMTARMVAESDAIVFYHEMPHVDMMETGQRAVRLLEGILARGTHPVSVFCKVPVHLPVERVNTLATPEQVAAGLFAKFPPHIRRVLGALETETWCLAAGLGTTQPWLNATELGATFVIVADASIDDSVEMAEAKAADLGRELWEARHQFMPSGDSLLPADKAVRVAFE
jgi:microcystin degradation protein MlrC